MRLRELEPQWLTVDTSKSFTRHSELSPEQADGILFKCPKCFKTNGGPIGTHSIICWQPRVSQEIGPVPGRWNFVGSSFDDLTLVAGSSSILLTPPGCEAHFFITNGEVTGE